MQWVCFSTQKFYMEKNYRWYNGLLLEVIHLQVKLKAIDSLIFWLLHFFTLISSGLRKDRHTLCFFLQ